MRLQLAEPITGALLLKAVLAGPGLAFFRNVLKPQGQKLVAWFNSDKGQRIFGFAQEIFKASPKAEQDRYNSTLAQVRADLGLNAPLTLEKAAWTLEQLPWLIEQANIKAAAGNLGEKRVQSRYIKVFQQIGDEVMAQVRESERINALSLTPPPNTTPPPSGAEPAIPGGAGASFAFLKNPIVLIGGAALLYLALRKK